MAANTKSHASVNSEHCRLWSPYKELHSVVSDAVIGGNAAMQGDLEHMLRKHRTRFTSLLETTPKNAVHRKVIEKAGTDGVLITGGLHSGTCSLDEATIAETLILSDLFDINEIEALELLLAGESQIAHYPGLTRGLVAVLLYHDGRRCLATALKTLVQARQGRQYSAKISQDMKVFITDYTDQLINDGVLGKILACLRNFDVEKLLAKMTEQRALGKPKHRHQVTALLQETKQSLADAVFHWSCQRPFTKLETQSLLQWLREQQLEGGCIDGAGLAVLFAFLYAIDTSLLDAMEGGEEGTIDLPMIADETFITGIHEMIKSESDKLRTQAQAAAREAKLLEKSGIHAVIQFSWSLTLRVASQYSQLPGSAASACCDGDDEELLDSALHAQVFKFISESIIKSPAFTLEEEFYIRKLHDLLTTFIVQMPYKVKELRDIGDDSARIILNHQQDGSEVPAAVRKDFQQFLQMIGDFYSLEINTYGLAEEYWCVLRPPSPKQISLHKFLRLAGELVPPPLFVPYLNMLVGLCSSEIGAIYCFNLLKANGEQASMVSWDHIFNSLNQYFTSLRQEVATTESEMVRAATARNPMIRDITAQELSGLVAVCKLIAQVSNQSTEVRCALAESQQWLPSIVLFGLVGCSVPIQLKAEILLALAALAKSPEVASNLWQTLELSQLLVTTVEDRASAKPAGGLLTELENVESRLETYPMLQGFLLLINNLCQSSDQPPETLGAGYRAPGFQPYLDFIINDVMLKFSSRGYKNSSEKWQVAAGALSILQKLLSAHQVEPEHFSDHLITLPTGAVVAEYKTAGHTLLTLLLQSSPLLSTLLYIISTGLEQLLQYNLTSAAREPIEECTLLSLQLLNLTLDKQGVFLDLLRQTGHSTIVSRLEKLLLGINPQTGQADHLVTISRYTSLVNLLPTHALHAVCIMGTVCKQPAIQAELLSLFLADSDVSSEIMSGLVEGIQQGADRTHTESDVIRCEMASGTLRLLLDTLRQPSPNIAHFLLGFNVNKPLAQTDLQTPGSSGMYRTCLHAAVSFVDSEQAPPNVVELAYQLIYTLCSNNATSAPVMRYLRTSQDFFYETLCRLPFQANQEDPEAISYVLKQQTWFMKSLALELRVTSLNEQRSHTQRLIGCLLDNTSSTFTSNIGAGADLSLTTFNLTAPNISTLAQLKYQRGTSQRRSRLLLFLDIISFDDISTGDITLEHFNTGSVMQVLSSCEERLPDTGLVAINVPQVHRLLIQEINVAQQTNTAPPTHREALLSEVKEILSYAVNWNTVRENVHMRLQAFDSWRQVSEIILSGCPEEAVGTQRRTVILDLLNAVIKKCLQDGSLDDLISPACGVVLTLMSNLRQTMFGKTSEESSLHTSLQLILKGILNLIVTSSGSLQRARANLYGALLYYLQMCESPIGKNIDPLQDGGVVTALMGKELANEKLARESMNVIYSFGDALLEVMCRDACDGFNVSRMLALSCLDSISALDTSQFHVLKFMSAHGYVRHLLESLVQSNGVLTQSLEASQPLRPLYIYESTMSLLTRLAMTAQGASGLLNAGLMLRLAECSVYDAKPSSPHHGFGTADSMEYEGLSPSVCTRYRQILLPCLKLCQTVLISLGVENENAANQVMKFIVAHADVFYNTLRDQTVETSESLEELSLLTAVLCRAAAFTSVSEGEEDREVMFRGQISRIQRKLGSLVSKYLLLDDWTKKFKSHESLSEAQRHQMLVYVHEIAANITCYCRNVIANSTHDSSYCRVLFGPNLSEALSHSASYAKASLHADYTRPSNADPPNLGLIVVQIKQASSKMLEALDEHKRLNTRFESLPITGSSSEQTETIESGVSESRQDLKLRLERQTHTIHLLSMVIENCLYVVWRHLDFFLLSCVPEDQNTSLFRTHHKASSASMRRLTDSTVTASTPSGDKSQLFTSSGITRAQLNVLRETTPQALNEPLLQKLADIEQCYASKRTHFGYIGALSRRLRRLINLHCS